MTTYAPVLFLDVDGVLNSLAWTKSGGRLCDLDPDACSRLDRVVRATRCELVLSSAWRSEKQRRNRYGVQRPVWFEKMLRARGCRSARFIGQTPSLAGPRGNEIQAWLDENPRHVFAIVDDTEDMVHLTPRLVRTSFETGLQDEHAERLVALLRGQA